MVPTRSIFYILKRLIGKLDSILDREIEGRVSHYSSSAAANLHSINDENSLTSTSLLLPDNWLWNWNNCHLEMKRVWQEREYVAGLPWICCCLPLDTRLAAFIAFQCIDNDCWMPLGSTVYRARVNSRAKRLSHQKQRGEKGRKADNTHTQGEALTTNEFISWFVMASCWRAAHQRKNTANISLSFHISI